MPLAHINGTMLFFAHIPKTGGSSVEVYMKAKGKVALLSPRSAGWSKTNPQHMPQDVFRRFLPDDFYDHGFTILRDPKARLISAFRMRAHDPHHWRNPLNWFFYPWARLRGKDVFSIHVSRWHLSVDFDTWVWLMTRVILRFKPYLYDGHCLPQVKFIHPGHKIFLFEDGLEPVFRWIDAVTQTEPVAGNFHEMKVGLRQVTCSPATERRLRAYYAEDYALIEAVRAGQVPESHAA